MRLLKMFLIQVLTEDETIMAPSGAMRSKIDDMLTWAADLLKAENVQRASGKILPQDHL